MTIPVKCPYCQHDWQFKGNPDKIFVTCPGCYKKVQLNSKPEKLTVKAPPALRKSGSVKLGQLQDGSTIVGEALSKATGRTIECESLTVVHKKHTIFPLRGNLLYLSKGITNTCELCGQKLKEDSTSVLFDGKLRAHSYCVLDQA